MRTPTLLRRIEIDGQGHSLDVESTFDVIAPSLDLRITIVLEDDIHCVGTSSGCRGWQKKRWGLLSTPSRATMAELVKRARNKSVSEELESTSSCREPKFCAPTLVSSDLTQSSPDVPLILRRIVETLLVHFWPRT